MVVCYRSDEFGVAAVERQTGQDLAVNFSIINLNAPITQSQIAVGSGITQTQSVDLNTLDDVNAYLDQHFAGRTEVQELKTMLLELNSQHERDEVRPSLVSRVRAIIDGLGPAASVIMEFVLKYYLGG